ncbi:hypothetical protein FGW20_11470 [Methanoculleus sp. FWC-SCC3]|uniref:PGF-pre-PGF domain-containing protein n=1 Tax=Methanoculleus methanifontis TaxID=2584086 RepID=A0ABT8M4W2_9EURY|nr:hypothetical protein [Methanoculleus sp. FWC-SCC3]MDN7013640.1 hypothetical protein [Methanoculleus sp. FWC-SCC3]
MTHKRSVLLPGIIIALLLLIPAAAAAGGGEIYITGTMDDAREYKQLCIRTVDALDPLDVDCTLVTLGSTETGDLGEFEYPLFGNIVREFDPASGTYHGVHVTVIQEKTVDGRTIPCEYRFYIKRTIPSFTVDVPGETGNVLLIKAPENLPEGANFTELFKAATKEGYLFKNDAIIYMNETGFTAYGSISSSDYYENDLAYTLNHNEVGLTGFTTDSSLARNMMDARAYTRPEAGEYLIAAVQYDGAAETMHVLAATPVLILDGNQAVAWDGGDPYYQDQNKDVNVSFSGGVDKVAYALVKKDTRYGLDMEVDTIELAKQPIPTSAADLVSILKTISGEAGPVTYALTVDGVPTEISSGSGFAIAEGYGCSGDADASKVTIPAATLKNLEPGTYDLYAMGMQGEKVVALDQTDVCIAAVAPTPTPTRRPGGGGGGTPTDTYTGSGTLKINSAGTVLKSVKINAEDGIGSLLIPIGTEALDAGGNPLTEISLIPVSNDTAPAFPSGAAFQFAGYVYEGSPGGATFAPAITLTLEIPEEDWNALDPTTQSLTVKWYNTETGEWEDVPTTVNPSTRTVRATISHFSTFALFTEPVTTATPTDTATPATPATPTTPGDETPDEGLPFTTILVIVIAVVIIAAAGYYFMTKK